MFRSRFRPLRFTERLALCVIAVPLLVLYARWSRADDPCPQNRSASVECPTKNPIYVPCEEYGQDCEGKTMTVVWIGDYECTGSSKGKTMCVPATNPDGTALIVDCWAEYHCKLGEFKCEKGMQKGNTEGKVLKTTKDCP